MNYTLRGFILLHQQELKQSAQGEKVAWQMAMARQEKFHPKYLMIVSGGKGNEIGALHYPRALRTGHCMSS